MQIKLRKLKWIKLERQQRWKGIIKMLVTDMQTEIHLFSCRYSFFFKHRLFAFIFTFRGKNNQVRNAVLRRHMKIYFWRWQTEIQIKFYTLKQF